MQIKTWFILIFVLWSGCMQYITTLQSIYNISMLNSQSIPMWALSLGNYAITSLLKWIVLSPCSSQQDSSCFISNAHLNKYFHVLWRCCVGLILDPWLIVLLQKKQNNQLHTLHMFSCRPRKDIIIYCIIVQLQQPVAVVGPQQNQYPWASQRRMILIR